MQDFKVAIANCLKEKIEELTLEEIIALIEVPPNKEMGDYAFPCFKLAKVFRKSPNMIAADLAESIEAKGEISKVIPLGGYVNFFVNKSQLAESVIKDVLTKKENYGHSDLGQDKAVVIDFSSPNIAKPFHIGHIRTTVIGNALYKIYDSQGYNVVRVNHLGDYGTQFGKLIVAFKLWGNKEAVEANPIPELLKLYIQFHEEAEKKPEMEDEARAWFTKLENGDEEAIEVFVKKYYSTIRNYCRLHTYTDCDAEDITQATFEHFFRSFRSYHHLGKTANYLYVIARNLCRDSYKKKRDIVMEELPDKGENPIAVIENKIDIEESIKKLPEDLQEVVILHYFQDLKLKEVAEATGIEIKSSQDCINYIIDSLNGETAKSDLEKLAKLDLIEIKSLNKDYASYDSVVLVGENEDENMKNSFEVKEKNIISKLKSEKKYLVAVQREESTSEFIKLCSDLNISTIDNIDSEVGKISLTMLVKDESKVGNYGIGENTTDLMPFSK